MAGFTSETRLYNTLITATFDAFVTEEASVNLLRATPLVDQLWKSGNSRVYDGGARIVGPVRFGFNPNRQWFVGADKLNMDTFESLTRYQYDWRMMHLPISYTGEEARKNSGRAQAINLITERINDTMDTAYKEVEIALASDGSLIPGKIILGLDALVQTDPTANPVVGAVGDIDASNIWWRNYAVTSFGSFAAFGPGGATSDNFATAVNSVSDGTEGPDFFIGAQDVFEFYSRTGLVAANQVAMYSGGTSGQTLDRSWDALAYRRKPWFWTRSIVSGRLFGLRRKDLQFWVHPKGNLTMSEFQQAYDADVYAAHVLLQCAFFATRRMFNFVLDGITA